MIETKSYDGILNIVKPADMTSFDVVAYLRRVIGVKKIGHTGTLDPNALGVLVICIGKATSAIPYMEYDFKGYRGEMLLGHETDTQDIYGNEIKAAECLASEKEIELAAKSFIGTYFQKPPMYSAIKIGGRKLYDIARAHESIEVPSRQIEIKDIKILKIYRDANNDVRVIFDVMCSKGAYIRTLCHDIGNMLGCGGCMSFLARTVCGKFELRTGITLEMVAQYAAEQRLAELLIPIESIFENCDRIELNRRELGKFLNGVWLPVSAGMTENLSVGAMKENELIRIYGDDGFSGIGRIMSENNEYVLKKVKGF